MEEKEKLTLEEDKKLAKKSSSKTAIAVAEKEEEIQEEKQDKTKVNLQKLRAQLETEKEQKKQMRKKEQAVVETPNYDMIKEISPEKRKQIYKVEKVEPEEKAKPFTFNKKLKIILFGLVFLLAGAFCISSGVQMINASTAMQVAQSEYELSLGKLIKKISKIDSGNKTLELIPTHPKELKTPSSIEESSNWFDRICNFISGLFGG